MSGTPDSSYALFCFWRTTPCSTSKPQIVFSHPWSNIAAGYPRRPGADSPMRDQTCGPGYPLGFRPKGIWCLGEDTRHLWRLMCFADLNFLPSVQLHLPVPVVFACRRDLLSLWDLCRSVSCCGNRMFLVSVSLDLELFWSRGTRFAPWAPAGCGPAHGGKAAPKHFWTRSTSDSASSAAIPWSSTCASCILRRAQ